MPIESGPQFLKDKYDLHNSPEVNDAAERTEFRTGEVIPQDPEERIQNYLSRFSEIAKREDPERRERGIEAVKQLLFAKFITKYEDIPQNYWRFQENIMRERGQGGDWAAADAKQQETVRRSTAEALIADQQSSLEQWVDYFASPDSSYIPDWEKYWVMRSVLGLQEYDKENKRFPQRSKGTLKQFPDINQEGLSYVLDAMNNHLQNIDPTFEYDIAHSEQEAFKQYLHQENFAKLYGWAMENMHPIPKHLVEVTDGQWRKFDQGSDSSELTQTIRGRATGWCTAGEGTAKTQLAAGDFYVFYSNDDEGVPTHPRIAIRMEDDKIAEVRGISYKQNLDPFMPAVLAEKLQEFPDGKQYLKKERDMSQLTTIEQKTKSSQSLDKQDLAFLYELDGTIEGFGYQEDPRIKELRSQRHPEEDMLIIFDCEPSQIAHNITEINNQTKAFVGQLEPGIFTKIAELPNIEHLYTNFPEGKIDRSELTIGGKTVDQLRAEMKEKNINSEYADYMLKKMPTLPNPELTSLIRLKVGDLGLTGQPTTDEIYARAAELGLELCPAEVGPHQRLKDNEQSLGDWYRIAMQQISGRDGDPSVFDLEHNDDGLWLGDFWAKPGGRWGLGSQFVFRLRKVSPDTERPKPLPHLGFSPFGPVTFSN